MSDQLESLLPASKHAEACAEDARQAEALRLHRDTFAAICKPARAPDTIVNERIAAADDLLAALERDSQRMAARCTTVRFTGFQATADAYLRALLRGQVLRLMGELSDLRAEHERVDEDKNLQYVELSDLDLGDVTVGIEYEPEIASRVTSAYTFERTGDPGDPGAGEVCEVVECWFRGADIAAVLDESTVDRLADKAAEKMRMRGDDAATEHALARAGL